MNVVIESEGQQFAAFAGKLDGLFARIALIFHCIEAINFKVTLEAIKVPEQVPKDAAERVARLMHEFLIPHALHFYLELAGETSAITDAQAIGGWILAHKVDRFTYGDLTTAIRRCRGKQRDQVRAMLELLEMFGWIEPDDWVLPRSWTVAPRVHVQFAERAAQEKTTREREREILREATKNQANDYATNTAKPRIF